MARQYAGDPLDIIHTVGLETVRPVVRVALTFGAPLDMARFKKALSAVVEVVPELACRYELADNSYVPVSGDILVTGVAEPDVDAVAWDLTKSPQLRIYWQSATSLVVYVSHVFSDGAGAKALLALIAQAYRTQTLAGETNSTNSDWLMPLVTKHEVVKSGSDHPAQELLLPQLADHDGQTYRVGRLSFSKAATTQLVKATHLAGVTVNDVVMSAFGRAVQRFAATETIALPCPTDMRKFAPDNKRRIANFTSRYNFSVAAPASLPFAALVRDVHDAMAANKAKHQCFDSVQGLLTQIGKKPISELQQIVAANYHMRAIAYTNFGVLSAKQVDFGIPLTDVVMTGGFRRAPSFQTAMATYDGRLTMAFNMIGSDAEYRFGMALLAIQHDLVQNFTLGTMSAAQA
ncbi:phthiocerol/phthiodiolone dimycocerosyl transferase family protein [Lacticaseibacillus sp. GG6-2]